jgi:hypothetical protein
MSGGGGATGYVYSVAGSGDSQFSRTLDQSGPYGQIPGNVIIGAQGQNVTPVSIMPTATELSAVQSGGRRRRKRGGFLGPIVNQAIVPLTLLGLQNTYRRKRGGGRSRRTRRQRRR